MSVDQTASLTVDILGDASSAVNAAQISQASLDKLNAAISGLTASFTAQNTAADANAAAHVKVGSSATEASVGVDKLGAAAARTTGLADALTEHSLLMSRGFQAAGIEAGAAATRVAALGDTMGRFAAFNPAILAIVTAMTVLFGAFEAFKGFVEEGASEAVKAQNSMAELKIAVEQNGGSWAQAEPKIKAWTDALAFSSGVISSQSLPALLNLVNAGQSLDGSMSEVAIAADVAAGGMGRMGRGGQDADSSTRRFNQAINALNEGLSGHVTRLEMIDGRLTPLIQKHASYHDILTKLVQDIQDNVSKNDSLQMSYQRLHGEVAIASEKFAQGFMPIANATIHVLSVMADALGHVTGAFVEMANGALQNIKAVISGVAALGEAIRDLASGNAIDLPKALGKIRTEGDALQHSFGTMGQGFGKAVYDAFHPATLYANDLSDAMKRVRDQTVSGLESIRSFAGEPKAKSGPGAGAVPGASAYEQDTAQYRLQAQAQSDLTKTTDALNEAKQRAQVSEAQLAANVKLATTSQAEAAATQLLNTTRTADAHQQVVLLTNAISDERGKQSELQQTVANMTQTLSADKAAQAAHTLELAGAHKESLGTREATSQYAAAVHDAQAQLNDAKAALKAYTDAIKAHNTELAAAIAQYLTFGSATNEALAKIQRDWSDFLQKQAQAETDAYAKRTMTARQYSAFLATQYASDYDKYVYWLQQGNDYWAGVYEERAKSDEEKLNQEKNAIYQADYANFKSVVDKMATTTTGFLENVLVLHKTLRDQLKNVWNDILKDFVSMLDQMLAKTLMTSSLLQRLLGFGGGGGGLNLSMLGAPSVGNPSGAGSPSATGPGMGAAGSSAAASLPGGAVPSKTPLGGGGALALAPGILGAAGGFGGTAGGPLVPALSPTFGANGSDAVYGGGYGGASPVPAAGGGAGTTLLSRFNIGGVSLGNMLMGAMAGGLIANMLDHGNQDAGIGGMVGGGIGTLLGPMLGRLLFTGGAALGPIGMILGGLLGSLAGTFLGGLFGDHFPKANEPDIYQTQAWGQELADMQGSTGADPMMANGQAFVMDSSTSSQTQGRGWNVLIESFVSKFRQNQKALPTELQAGFPMLDELWGGAQNSPDFNGNGKNGMLQIGSGTMAEWTTFWSYVSAYGPAIAQLMAMFQPVDLYAASPNGSVSEVGGYSPTGEPWLLHSFPDAGLPAGASSAAPQMISTPGGSKQTVTNVNVYQQFGGSLIAENAMNERIYKAISNIPGFSQTDLVGT